MGRGGGESEVEALAHALVQLAVSSSLDTQQTHAKALAYIEREKEQIRERARQSEAERQAVLREGEEATRRLQQQLRNLRDAARLEVANAEARTIQAMEEEWRQREMAIRWAARETRSYLCHQHLHAQPSGISPTP